MPTRHISSQSFDEILSDLGDDPAIPDPQGIRKNTAPPSSQANSFSQPKTRLEESFKSPDRVTLILLTAGTLIAACLLGLFFLLESLKQESQTTFEELTGQVNKLKKDLVNSTEQWALDQEELFLTMDEIEVSIHSKLAPKESSKVNKAPVLLPFEQEVLRWRYLGLTQIGGVEQVFFHTGKQALSIKRGEFALGEWRLSHIQKESVILTHAKGKAITLKSAKRE
ncbi:hypothetical protein SAMN06295945_1244 [Polynucleobacter meluiroseus]|uniref:Uncharacterized protein n=1 Tax=Polynucleobacter meluiroseus TaxID=1938814 RepID=A0A240E0B9_9BURK|nr:hypothetical protein [Polynucleobacter meluiroseus]SNX28885.1 hypothetical protein SAMN06295945_1244 [Polynucleobacter meluiroseus]